MKRRRVLREPRLAYVAVGALTLAIPASAAALVTSATGAAAPKASRTANPHSSGGTGPRATIARVHVRSRSIDALSGSTITLRGHVAPGLPWRRVRLEAGRGHGWNTIASSQTGRHGRFRVRYTANDLGGQALRVVVGGGPGTPAVSASAGGLTVFRESVASWYSDGGGTACGFHATYGVANRTLPCGSKVTFVYGGRRVTATVDDRGPFVGGREWDLNQNTAGALGFDGVQTVWSSA
jgi:peptidoglycan lytic transglycosylase